MRRSDRLRLVRLSAALASRDRERLEEALEAALALADGDAVEEALLQSYLFLGYPAALNAFALWRRLSGRPAPEPTDDDPGLWRARGAEVCRAVYGAQVERLRENVRALHPDLERWMLEEGYGKVLARPNLTLADRELCIAAMLAVQGAPRQLYAHLRGALRAGVPVAEVDEALEVALTLATPELAAAAREVWHELRGRIAAAADGRTEGE